MAAGFALDIVHEVAVVGGAVVVAVVGSGDVAVGIAVEVLEVETFGGAGAGVGGVGGVGGACESALVANAGDGGQGGGGVHGAHPSRCVAVAIRPEGLVRAYSAV